MGGDSGDARGESARSELPLAPAPRQDARDQGSVYPTDAISFTIRWEFGGGWVDYRGALVANV